MRTLPGFHITSISIAYTTGSSEPWKVRGAHPTRLFKIAVRVVQYKDRIKLHLPSSCSVKALLHQVTEILFQVREPAWNTS